MIRIHRIGYIYRDDHPRSAAVLFSTISPNVYDIIYIFCTKTLYIYYNVFVLEFSDRQSNAYFVYNNNTTLSMVIICVITSTFFLNKHFCIYLSFIFAIKRSTEYVVSSSGEIYVCVISYIAAVFCNRI